MRAIWIIALMTAASCGKANPDDWSGRPKKTMSGKRNGVAFTIELPEGMVAEPDGAKWEFNEQEPMLTVSVYVGSMYKPTLEAYITSESKTEVWVRKDKLPDGYIVTYENPIYKGKNDYLIYSYRKFGDIELTCSARINPSDPKESVQNYLPLVEKMCLSLKPAS